MNKQVKKRITIDPFLDPFRLLIPEDAKKYLKQGISVIPTKENKLPAVSSWTPYQKERLNEKEVDALWNREEVTGVAIICGAISGNLEVIDIDSKYDNTGSLWTELTNLIKDNLPELYDSLVIAQTKSGGYHLYYRCSSIEGNLKLANRETTPEEREATYNKEKSKGVSEEDAKRRAKNDKVRVLIETRGEGGYVVAPTTDGYRFLKGDTANIPNITPHERDILFSIAKSFNQVPDKDPVIKDTASGYTGLSPLEDYNQRGDVIGLLRSRGWTIVSQIGERINVLRPGGETKTSGNFHTRLRVLRVFSQSTEFETNRGYSPSQVYALLECGGDFKLAYRRLLENNYGEPYKPGQIKPTQVKTDQITVEVVNPINRENTIISKPGESLRIENIETAIGEEVVIISPGVEAVEEVLKAINLIQETDRRIYIKEAGEEIRDYSYQLRAIFNKYGALQGEAGGLTDRQIDSLKDEIVLIGQRLQPLDRDVFKKQFLSLDAIRELGITQESYLETIERLTTTKTKEAQNRKLQEILSQANKLQGSGRTVEAIESLESQLKEIRITGARDLLPPAMSFNSLLEDIANTPQAYRTGYSSLDNFIGFTPGAVTLVAGRPSHGKTTFMFNLLIQMSKEYPEERFYFFSYEEPVKNISIKLLNRIINSDLRKHFFDIKELHIPTNYNFLKHYIKAGRTDIAEVENGKRLLKELIDSRRITVVDRSYSVEELGSLLAYLNKKEKLGPVIIDYIQRMHTGRKTQDKRTEIAHISNRVREIAVETGLPIILGAQLNRATLEKAGGKPKLENLKEAGNLEEDANTVLSVYCEAREDEEKDNGGDLDKKRSVDIEIKALKNRDGEGNVIQSLNWDRWTGVITNPKSNFR